MRTIVAFFTIVVFVASALGAAPSFAKGQDLRIDRVGRIERSTPTVAVSGAVTCSATGTMMIHAHVRQTTVATDGTTAAVHGDGYGTVQCASPGEAAKWQVSVFSPKGRFVSGEAEAFANASLDDAAPGSSGYLETPYATVCLRSGS